jgi:N-acetylglucosaminyldiphosphoundecaprenol N-acetyl-beta-D-mannosaminyltransferase
MQPDIKNADYLPSKPPARINILGVGVSVLNLDTATELIAEAIKNREKGYICVTGVHGVSEAQNDPAFKKILNRSFLCTPDGMPLVWIGRLRGYSEMKRVYGPDLMKRVCEWSRSNNCVHFLYGGMPGVADDLKKRLETDYPGIKVGATFTPPFRPLSPDEEKELIALVDKIRPDIIWVGLSTPKQERFMAEYLYRLNTTLMIGVGAAFDFLTGRVKQAPRWIQRIGLEWFFRMCCEPKRLATRYLKNNPLFILRLFMQATGLKKYPLE